jgi:Polyketide cyclase / dehydrase and lipid transport
MLALLPLGVGTLGFDTMARPDVFEVHSSIEIAAPPERVWKNVVTFSELPPPTEWYFKTGIAYPMRAGVVGIGPGAVRYREFSTGPFVEPIQVWDEPHLLRFSVIQNPAPSKEWSPYPKIVPVICTGI